MFPDSLAHGANDSFGVGAGDAGSFEIAGGGEASQTVSTVLPASMPGPRNALTTSPTQP